MSVSLMQMVLCLPVETEKEGDEGYCFSLATRSPCSKYVDHHTKTCNKMSTQSLCVPVGVILVSSGKSTILECGSTHSIVSDVLSLLTGSQRKRC